MERGEVKGLAQPLAESAIPLASIQLYNQTSWTGQTSVEIPIGHLAAPGLIDWTNVRLEQNGVNVPFSIREGRVHWKADLKAPITKPRAEDLLVFPVAIPKGEWIRVDVILGKPSAQSAQNGMKHEAGSIVVSYPNLKVTVNEESGMLTGLESSGVSLIDGPLGVDFYTVSSGTIERSGEPGPSYDTQIVKVKKNKKLDGAKARLVSSSSTPALTEMNFILNPAKGPVLGLTYRIHASGCVEIWSDERPWQGISPWVDFAVDHRLKLAGSRENLPYLQTRDPFYGFKDYSSVVNLAGTIHHTPKADVMEFGENTINGRRWMRQLYLNPHPDPATTKALVEMVTEGPIVHVTPLAASLGQSSVNVAAPADCKAAAELLVKALKASGIQTKTDLKSPGNGKSVGIQMELTDSPQRNGISGDGFVIRSNKSGKAICILAGTRFGLMQGALKVAEFLQRNPQSRALPLIASNPAVDLRCGGFGGGNHEVDFPYGSEAEWEQVFDNLIASGMNKLTCLGMWGNWKLPASFKYMPELKSNAPDAYDEVSGAKFTEFDQHREKGQRLIKYLHERGADAWLWVPVGCVPTTFADKHPEAMCPGSKKTPRFMHPTYRAYLDAFFKEILETYPLDGFMLIRDDNGGLDNSPEYKEFIAASRTKDPAWEQYILIYDLLRKKGFKGTIMVYPYMDPYQPRLDPLIPKDLYIGGHGSGIATLTHDYEVLAPMGDVWLDNIYTSFRVAPMRRMKRLLADRGSYWIGGAYCGTELPWESIGYFGWQPTASVNTFRYDWAMRTFGDKTKALDFASFSNAYENLWDIYNLDLLPYTWQCKMTPAQRQEAAKSGRSWLALYRERLNKLNTPVAARQPDVPAVKETGTIVRQDGSGPGGYKTIDAAVKAAGSSGTVIVDDNGTYEENFGIQLEKGWKVTIKAADGKTPTLRCVKKNNGWFDVFIYLATNGTLTVDGFKIAGTSGKTLTGGFMMLAGDGSGSEVTIQNCLITGDWGNIISVGGAMGDASNSKVHLISNRIYPRNHLGLINAQPDGKGNNLLATIDRCTVMQDPTFDVGSAVGFLYGDIPTNKPTYRLTNSIFWDTTRLIYLANGASIPYTVSMDSCVYDQACRSEFVTVNNCKMGDPLFKDSAKLDFTLKPASTANWSWQRRKWRQECRLGSADRLGPERAMVRSGSVSTEHSSNTPCGGLNCFRNSSISSPLTRQMSRRANLSRPMFAGG